ncbi:inactive hydroxysteroid dehydrogenase-like protein 1 isoform X1 [Mytilus trossulus]|uniref:inactive hydroxysteroid dehydrogenase-like protein 1 isoform X1 n=1 Tax=Mytilus trossulus TaxID=6551 RepID=UPI0030045D28
MAVVDSFDFLLKELERTCTNTRDILAVIGVLYACKRTLQCLTGLIKATNDHLLSKLSYISNYKKRFGPWAVVTGSSEGIGLAYAKELANRGLNIVMISRGENKLYRAAKDIEEQYKVETCTIAVDFAHGKEIYEKIWNLIKDKEIGILVNNVGVMYEFPQLFLDVPVERLWSLVNVNVAAATMMTHLIMPQMVQRGKGAVVMLASGSSSQITPQMTVYAATKYFLDYFARGLQYEYRNSGVIVQSLMPFYVATRMTRYSQTLSKPGLFIPSADTYAKSAIATLGYSSRTSGYWPHTIQAWISDSIPEWLWMWGATRLNNALRRQGQEKLHHKKTLRKRGSELSIGSDS